MFKGMQTIILLPLAGAVSISGNCLKELQSVNRKEVLFMLHFPKYSTFLENNAFHTKGVLGIRLLLRKFGHSSLDI